MRRHALLMLAILLLIVFLYGWITNGLNDGDATVFFTTCERIGLVLGAMWLAYPQLVVVAARTSSRFVLMMIGIGLIILVRPKSVFILGPVMLVLAALQFAGWLMAGGANREGGGRRPESGGRRL
jgi:hypothetical protein